MRCRGSWLSDPFAILTWVGLAAVALLAPALVRPSSLPLGDAALVVVVLGLPT